MDRRNGATDYLLPDGSEGELVGATLQQCMDACPAPNCTGFKYKPWDGNKCFLRSYITLGECAPAEGQDTWVYVGSPSSDWERHPNLNCMEGCVCGSRGSADEPIMRPSAPLHVHTSAHP